VGIRHGSFVLGTMDVQGRLVVVRRELLPDKSFGHGFTQIGADQKPKLFLIYFFYFCQASIGEALAITLLLPIGNKGI